MNVHTVVPMRGVVSLFACLMVALLTICQPSHAALPPGSYDLGWPTGLLVMNGKDARSLGDALARTSPTQDNLNRIAGILIKFMPAQKAWNFARYICYNGINSWVRNRIYYCAWKSNTVYTYTWRGIPYWADPA